MATGEQDGWKITCRGVVYPWHCDHMGHMNVMWYVGKFDEATWGLFATFGITPAYVRESGCGMVAVEQKIQYQRELLAGDLVLVRSRLLEVRDKALRFEHELVNAQANVVSATTELVGVHLDLKLRKAVPFPAEIAERARRLASR